MGRHPYCGMSAALATMHEKERAVGPAFMRHLRISIESTDNLDTDQFGTFTGEVPRRGSAIETAIGKAKLATTWLGTRLGLGSEGSFGPHRSMPFVPVGHEVLAFHDSELDVTIVEHLTTMRTNYSHIDLTSLNRLDEFLHAVKFPTHGVIVSALEKERTRTLAKGIKDPDKLKEILRSIGVGANESRHGIRISTDMRAHMNPSRMAAIRALATRLALRIARLCPGCCQPGFGEKTLERGIPCSWCGEDVLLAHSLRMTCTRCGYSELKPLSRAPRRADPRYCQNCNP